MKLNEDKPNVETSGTMEEKLFSIEDTGMIFDILRNKMYSDPIRAICREITSNARDAHREVNKSDVPCEISLPNFFDPHYKVKDFGPGISPDRMANVFIKYTASTKRSDNKQTGGFGLGAKTPFSYNDSFDIETVVDGIKYSYSCVIDATKCGKLVCMNEEPTTLPNGTEIVIPVKNADYKKFIDDTEFVTRHWEVRPTIKGATFDYKNITPSLKGKNYAVCKSTSNNVIREVKLVVDGIEYPLDLAQLKGFASTKVLDAINGVVYLYFNVGDLSLSATREAVHLDKPTQAKIADKLNEIVQDLAVDVKNQIEAQPSLWAASIYANTQLQKTFSSIDFLLPLHWKGTEIVIGNVPIKDAKVHAFTKGKYSRGHHNPDKIHKVIQTAIHFTDNAEIYLCDLELKEPQVKNVSKAFEADSTLKYLYVVQANDGVKIADVDKVHNLSGYGAKKLSTITKVGRNYNISGVRLLVFKFVLGDNCFKQVSYASMEEDTNDKVICSLNRDSYNGTRNITLKNKKTLTNDIVKSLVQSNPKYSIYGVDNAVPTDKLEEHFSDFKPVDDFIEEKVFANKKLDFNEIKYAMRNQWNLDRHIDKMADYKIRISDPKSVYVQYVELNLALKEIINTHQGVLNIYESVKGNITDKDVDTWIALHPEQNVQKLKDSVQKSYPLLAYLDYYNSTRTADPIIHYINLVDKELNGTI